MNSKIYIIILIIVICILYYYNKSKTIYLLKGVKDSKKDVFIQKRIVNNFKQGMEYTYSLWIYIKDWDYLNGQPKHIFNTGTDDLKVCSPGLFLHPNNNEINLVVDTYNYDNRFDKLQNSNVKGKENSNKTGSTKDICMKECINDKMCNLVAFDKHNKKCLFYNTNETYIDDKTKLQLFAKKKFKTKYDEINNRSVLTLKNIPLQRWFNLSIVLDNRNISVYLDGKLVKSTLLQGIPTNVNNNVFVNLDGGYNGEISDIIYNKRALDANEIYSLYRYGINNQKYNEENDSGTSKKDIDDYNEKNGKEKKGFIKNLMEIFNNLF